MTRVLRSALLLAWVAATLSSAAYCLVASTARGDSFFSTPPVTSGLVVDFDASDIAKFNGGTISNGQAVTSWGSSVGSVVASQGTASRQPTWVSNVLNGMPVVRFDGNISAGQGDNIGFTLPSALGADATAFVVALNGNQTTASGSCCRAFFSENTGGTNIGNNGYSLYINGNDTAGPANTLQVSKGTGTTAPSVTSVIGRDLAYHIFSFSSTNSTNGTSLYLDGNQVGNGTLNSTPTGLNYLIGGNAGAIDARNYLGDIAEIMIFNRALSAAEQNSIGYFLAQKYGLNTSFAAPPVTPEPSSIALCSVVMVLAGAYWWRRRR